MALELSFQTADNARHWTNFRQILIAYFEQFKIRHAEHFPYRNTSRPALYCRNIAATVSGNIATILLQRCPNTGFRMQINIAGIRVILQFFLAILKLFWQYCQKFCIYICIDGIKLIFKIHLIKLRTTINADRSQSSFPTISSITVVADRAGQCIAENLNIPKRKHSIPVEITIFNLR